MFDDLLIGYDDLILITGSNGFIGSRVVETILSFGFRNIRCFVRPSSNLCELNKIIKSFEKAKIELVVGNLLSKSDCTAATKGVAVIINLAAGFEKTFPGCFMNSVVTTKNVLDSMVGDKNFKRFVNISSFAVYSNYKIKRGAMLDETCEIETHFMERNEAYCYGKTKQDELLIEYGKKYGIPYVIVRPGFVYGPKAKQIIPPRMGTNTFGKFIHILGPSKLPLAYIDNCAEAIVMAGIKKGVDGEIFNVVDDELPTSWRFLRMYKKTVGHFKSIYVPYRICYVLCYLWEKYSQWSDQQVPPVFNRRKCAAAWKGNQYSNAKLRKLLGWSPKVPSDEGLKNYFVYLKAAGGYK